MNRRRLVFEWRAAVTVAAAVAVAALLVALPLPIDAGWLLAVVGAILFATVAVVAVSVYRLPVLPAAPTPGQLRDRDVAAAAVAVRRGRAVEPPALQAAAIDLARRSLRTAHLTFVALPMSGASLTLNTGGGGFSTVARLIGAVCLALGLGGLVASRRVQHRLNTLEDTSTETPTTSPPNPAS